MILYFEFIVFSSSSSSLSVNILKYFRQSMLMSLWFSLLPELSFSYIFKTWTDIIQDYWKSYPFDILEDMLII